MGTCTPGRGSSGRSVGDNPGKVVGFAGWAEGIMTRSDLFETYFFVVVFVVASSYNGWTIFQPDLLVFISCLIMVESFIPPDFLNFHFHLIWSNYDRAFDKNQLSGQNCSRDNLKKNNLHLIPDMIFVKLFTLADFGSA